jgi:hypothetical protein
MYHLTQLKQDLRQQATEIEKQLQCQSGEWKPEACRCGHWDSTIGCQTYEQGRSCLNTSFCCNNLDGTWNCRSLEETSPTSPPGE